MNKEMKAIQKFAHLDILGKPLFCSTISIFELFQGKGIISNYQKESEKIENVISKTAILPFNKESAKAAGIISANQNSKGQMIGQMDSMIAGVAKSNNLAVLTRNIKDFNRIQNLAVEGY